MINKIIEYLKNYNGRELSIMEVCGTHTAAIFKGGIRSLISPKIRLISGPGCPVCVTPTSYIDKTIEYAKMSDHIVLTFGDMMKVPGANNTNLSLAKGDGANVEIMYSPFEVIKKANENKDKTYVIAAVGFETTAPVYGVLAKEIVEKGIPNVKLLTSIKTIEEPLKWICNNTTDEYKIDGFLCPGHVSTIIGSKPYEKLAEEYGKPFVVSGFSTEHILAAVYNIVKQIEDGIGITKNLYMNAVAEEGNIKAQQVLQEVFDLKAATWRGIGKIDISGLYLKDKYKAIDAGSEGLDRDEELDENCRCKEVIIGRINPDQCNMFGKGCTPLVAKGPCMVSSEGACGIWYKNRA